MELLVVKNSEIHSREGGWLRISQVCDSLSPYLSIPYCGMVLENGGGKSAQLTYFSVSMAGKLI